MPGPVRGRHFGGSMKPASMSATPHATAAPSAGAAAVAMQDACCGLLATQLRANPGVISAVVGTADGRAFAHASQPDRKIEAPRIAAIATSLLALSESFSKEALNSRAQYNCIATQHGTIVVVRVPSRARAHVLCLWADQSENFAMTLRLALDSAALVAALIDQG